MCSPELRAHREHALASASPRKVAPMTTIFQHRLECTRCTSHRQAPSRKAHDRLTRAFAKPIPHPSDDQSLGQPTGTTYTPESVYTSVDGGIPVDDILETVHHFMAIDNVIDTAEEKLYEEIIKHLRKPIQSAFVAVDGKA